ncbi:hypothetical protein GQR58_001338 [Nymphon striatum]|nr:hypothetical protein GQR58_001338 [Nymphon striatum]
MSLPPALEALLQLILCGCMGNCTTGHCTCKRNGLSCSDLCQCGDSCDNPHNYDLEEERHRRCINPLYYLPRDTVKIPYLVPGLSSTKIDNSPDIMYTYNKVSSSPLVYIVKLWPYWYLNIQETLDLKKKLEYPFYKKFEMEEEIQAPIMHQNSEKQVIDITVRGCLKDDGKHNKNDAITKYLNTNFSDWKSPDFYMIPEAFSARKFVTSGTFGGKENLRLAIRFKKAISQMYNELSDLQIIGCIMFPNMFLHEDVPVSDYVYNPKLMTESRLTLAGNGVAVECRTAEGEWNAKQNILCSGFLTTSLDV